MKISESQKNQMTKLIVRFLKETKQYQHRLRNVNIFNGNYFLRIEFLSNSYMSFCKAYMNHQIDTSVKMQLKFIKYIKRYTSVDEEALFMEFLKANGIKYDYLLDRLYMLYYNNIISKDIYKLRLEIIEEHKPHILRTLYTFTPNEYFKWGITYEELFDKWCAYYKRNLKINFV